MIFPGSFIWRRISDEWLVGKKASVLFAVSSVLIAGMTAALFSDVLTQDSGSLITLLWGGMWRYWMLGEPSNRAARRIWFLFLVVGMWYGAVLYYALVYLSASARRNREHLEGTAR
jgi:hypothetical protein